MVWLNIIGLRVVQQSSDITKHYTSKEEGRLGFEEEKWHWTYLPLSSLYLDAYQKLVEPSNLDGFSGSQEADTLQVIPVYVMGIEQKLFEIKKP